MAGKSQRNFTDVFMAAAVVVVIAMIIIPLPTPLLDALMALNVLSSVLILLLVIFSSRAIDFSSFPTVLLISTVFGLGLNVSSTRLILSNGTQFNGKMVKAFSNFVVGSNDTKGLVVGLVIFIIIIAVQTFVITKGATRVAEVAARFTLDAMPQKQMAAEQEYNSGVITEDELKVKKNDIQREADFYGNMDGASKFVSGNVKVGIFITILNVVAGLIIGVGFGNEDFASAVGIYTSLTIGDGLLSQLPSLLISFATGLIVTRSASEQGATLGSDIKKQFSQSSLIYYVGGAVMFLIGILPGFPWYILIPLGVALFYVGWRLGRLNKKAAVAVAAEKSGQKAAGGSTSQAPSSTNMSPIAPLDPLSLELGYVLIPLVDKDKGAELLERVMRMRREAALDLGLVVPSIRIIDNISLDPSEYSFKIKGVEVGRGKIRMGCYMCMNAGGVIKEIQGDPTRDPAFGLPAIWVPEKRREEAERAGYAVVDPPTIIATHLTELIKRHASEILGRQEVQSIIDALKKDYPAVTEEVTKLFTLGEIQKVMQGLLNEQVSVRNMVVILETMADYGNVTKKTDILVERVREALGRQICLQYAETDNNDVHTLKVLTVDVGFLNKLVESRVETTNGPMAALEPALHRSWIASLSGTIASIREKGFMPVIMCPSEARLLVKKSTEREIPSLVVISASEIAPDIHVERLGEIKVGD
ncbi:MAG: flagellar biosynthesis protein FlhA [Treponemataceae bacterium]|nr:flagellar biosynthesis protein FlhA [Treponemataceae bacterium]